MRITTNQPSFLGAGFTGPFSSGIMGDERRGTACERTKTGRMGRAHTLREGTKGKRRMITETPGATTSKIFDIVRSTRLPQRMFICLVFWLPTYCCYRFASWLDLWFWREKWGTLRGHLELTSGPTFDSVCTARESPIESNRLLDFERQGTESKRATGYKVPTYCSICFFEVFVTSCVVGHRP